MNKLLFLICLVSLFFAGCAEVKTQAKTVADQICAMDQVERAVLRQEIDDITSPHLIRIECNVQ